MPEDTRTTADRYELRRFVDAQHAVYLTAIAELNAGHKRTHWMWFIFPQMEGLGHSAMALHFAIHSRKEALSYLEHPLLGLRLTDCVEAVLKHKTRSVHEIFGSPDDLKFHSSMTLFAEAGGGFSFKKALHQFFDGKRDATTLALLGR